jgi:hypothetical protein
VILLPEITPAIISQLFLMAILALGYLRYRAGDIRGHGFLLVGATIIHYGSVLALMIPVLIDEYPNLSANPLNIFTFANIIHAATGAVALILAAYISLRWIINKLDSKKCVGRTIMQLTILNWSISLVIGLIIHLTT